MNGISYLKTYLKKENVVESIYRQLILFLIIGGICFAVDLGILVFLVEVLHVKLLIATGIAVLVATYVAYELNVRYIFIKGKFSLSKEIFFFYIFSAVGFFLNIGFMYLFAVYFLMWYVIAKILVTIIVALFNFSTRKWFIFNK